MSEVEAWEQSFRLKCLHCGGPMRFKLFKSIGLIKTACIHGHYMSFIALAFYRDKISVTSVKEALAEIED